MSAKRSKGLSRGILDGSVLNVQCDTTTLKNALFVRGFRDVEFVGSVGEFEKFDAGGEAAGLRALRGAELPVDAFRLPLRRPPVLYLLRVRRPSWSVYAWST